MDFIIDSDTLIQYSIFSKEGLKLLNSYLKSYKIGAKKTEKLLHTDENHDKLATYLKKFDKNMKYNRAFKNP